MNNLINRDQGLPHPENLPLFGFPLPNVMIDVLPYQEVLETLDVFEEILIKGRVVDQMGLPVAGALIEMWHAAQWGMSGMEYGPAFAPIDPDGQMWACMISDENGEYYFKTLKKPFHAAPPSISVDIKVTDEDANVTLTKLYLNENQLDPADPYLMDMEMYERSQFFGKEAAGVYEFNIQT